MPAVVNKIDKLLGTVDDIHILPFSPYDKIETMRIGTLMFDRFLFESKVGAARQSLFGVSDCLFIIEISPQGTVLEMPIELPSDSKEKLSKEEIMERVSLIIAFLKKRFDLQVVNFYELNGYLKLDDAREILEENNVGWIWYGKDAAILAAPLWIKSY